MKGHWRDLGPFRVCRYRPDGRDNSDQWGFSFHAWRVGIRVLLWCHHSSRSSDRWVLQPTIRYDRKQKRP